MFKIFGETYYLDLHEMEKKSESHTQSSEESEKTISPMKFEVLKTMVDVIMSEQEPMDEMLSSKSREVSIPFRIAFNTLLVNNIIKSI